MKDGFWEDPEGCFEPAESCRKTCPYTRYCKADSYGLKSENCPRAWKIEDIINDVESAKYDDHHDPAQNDDYEEDEDE